MWGNPNNGWYPPGGGPMFQLPPNTTMKDVERLMKLMDKVSMRNEEKERKKKDGEKKPPQGQLGVGQVFMIMTILSPVIGITSAFYAISAFTEMMAKIAASMPH